MDKKIEHFDIAQAKNSHLDDGLGTRNYLGHEFALILDSEAMPSLLRLGQPYRTTSGRLIRIVNGTAVYRINLVSHTLHVRDFLMLPPQTIVEIESHSDDFAAEALVVAELLDIPPDMAKNVYLPVPAHLSLGEEDWLHRTTIMEAKVLLKHSPLRIYEIADRLRFPEATTFNRYFKKREGMTPQEYREE